MNEEQRPPIEIGKSQEQENDILAILKTIRKDLSGTQARLKAKQ